MVRMVGKLKGLVALLLVVMAAVVAAPGSASATSGNPSYCDQEVPRLTNANIGDEVPVVMVHGMGNYSTNATVWGSIDNPSSFAGRVDRIPGVAVAHLFHYDTSVWVDQDSGPTLAKTIDCVSRLSLQNGGKGKVIVVGYSMGGLVARDALNRRSTDGQRAIADEVGQAVTIGSPHRGANVWAWSVFNAGSTEMARLPHFPPQTTVHTIAGDVIRVYHDQQGREERRDHPYDDTLVTTLSAHAESTIDVDRGGGEKTVTCEMSYRKVWWWYTRTQPYVPCEHTQLINNASNGVREDTIAAIEKYVASLAPTPGVSLKVGGLTTTYDSRWKNVDYGMSGPGLDGSATDTTNGAPCTNCSDTPPPTISAFVQLDNIGSWCHATIQECAVGSYEVVGTAPSVTIGGRTPDYSARYLDSGYQGTSLVWCLEDEQVCIHYRRSVDTPQLEPSQALLDVFRTASWD